MHCSSYIHVQWFIQDFKVREGKRLSGCVHKYIIITMHIIKSKNLEEGTQVRGGISPLPSPCMKH